MSPVVEQWLTPWVGCVGVFFPAVGRILGVPCPPSLLPCPQVKGQGLAWAAEPTRDTGELDQ